MSVFILLIKTLKWLNAIACCLCFTAAVANKQPELLFHAAFFALFARYACPWLITTLRKANSKTP